VGTAAHGMLKEGLLPAVAGLNRRAARGRVDAVKLLFESSKFHSPKMQHEHSGEVHIKLDLPRPTPVLNEGEGEEIVDAEVVD